MHERSIDAMYAIRDSLDQASALCRKHWRIIVSQLIAVHIINLALLSLLYPLLDLPASPMALWSAPIFVGNPFLLFDTLFFAQRDLDPRVVAILVGDCVVVLTCLRALLIPRFAHAAQAPQPAQSTVIRFRQRVLPALVAHGFLLSIVALTVMIVRGVLPYEPLVIVFLRPSIGRAFIDVLFAGVLFVLAAILLGGRFAFAPHISLLEQRSGLRSMRRSWHLTRPVWRTVVGLMLVLDGLLALVIFLPATLPILDALAPSRIGQWQALIRLATFALNGLALIVVPFHTAATTVLYEQLRQRIEGVDLERGIEAVVLHSAPDSTDRSSR